MRMLPVVCYCCRALFDINYQRKKERYHAESIFEHEHVGTTLLYYVLFSGVFLRLVVDSAAAVLGLLCLIFSRGSKTKSA